MISVASYNIRKSVGTDWKRRPERILSVISEVGADIVALQEVDRRFGSRATSLETDLIEAETDYTPVRFSLRDQSLGWHGNVILVRKGIEVIDSRRLVLPAFEPRGAVLADLSISGFRLRVIGMHLGLIGLWRKRQAQAVLDQLEALEETLPTVMMGDLNEWTTEGGCLAHFSRDHHVVAPGPSFHATRPFLTFDRIITSIDLAVPEAGVHTSPLARQASDHLPVWARLHHEGPAAARLREEIARGH
ncbi:endonuclease [Arsenicitalea aurantiaca]|uniref:Endonuclease n=1 Tax=Arsenicitalea aurantiaca TaxID=1783274 RepID=A0A433X3F0_9HYPH|nr:endonuclease/exonuclease/phosphatase family protein [Arsenicitalea aurantiaca]RUT28586.1 endonuclease [Arsenicitalea aurantiaca]